MSGGFIKVSTYLACPQCKAEVAKIVISNDDAPIWECRVCQATFERQELVTLKKLA